MKRCTCAVVVAVLLAVVVPATFAAVSKPALQPAKVIPTSERCSPPTCSGTQQDGTHWVRHEQLEGRAPDSNLHFPVPAKVEPKADVENAGVDVRGEVNPNASPAASSAAAAPASSAQSDDKEHVVTNTHTTVEAVPDHSPAAEASSDEEARFVEVSPEKKNKSKKKPNTVHEHQQKFHVGDKASRQNQIVAANRDHLSIDHRSD